MKRRTNCCNCGAPLPVSAPKCEFCGTRNIDLTMIDFGADEPVNFVFKMPSNIKVLNRDGAEIYMSMLGRPVLEGITQECDTVDTYGGYGMQPIMRYTANRTFSLGMHIEACPRQDDNTIATLEVH